jgi:hypothetical protein
MDQLCGLETFLEDLQHRDEQVEGLSINEIPAAGGVHDPPEVVSPPRAMMPGLPGRKGPLTGRWDESSKFRLSDWLAKSYLVDCRRVESARRMPPCRH